MTFHVCNNLVHISELVFELGITSWLENTHYEFFKYLYNFEIVFLSKISTGEI